MNEAPQVLVRTVREGDVIRSHEFENLIFKDIIDLDASAGFYVNPFLVKKQWDNTTWKLLENPGKIKRILSGRKSYVDMKWRIDPTREFVVIRTFRHVESIKEQISEDSFDGRYPLTVLAKMLSPDGQYDPHGIEIEFNMESTTCKHLVQEVEQCGFIKIEYVRVF